MTLVAGVDSSTQSCKIVIRDLGTGAVVRSGRASHPTGTEIDPDVWWQALATAADAAGGLADVAAISVAAQQHGMVALDRDGRVIRPALLWNDTRSAAASTALIEHFGGGDLAAGAAELARRTGSVPLASFTAAKLRWLREHEPDHAARLAAVALPHDWLSWRLRGFGPDNPDLSELTTDRSDASGTGYWSPVTGAYDREILGFCLGDAVAARVVLPRVLRATESPGVTAATPVSPAGIVLGPGAGDNAAAALGLGMATGDVAVSIGTSGTVFAVSPTPVQDSSGTIAGFADASGNFLPLVATLNAARVLDAIARLLRVDHDELARLALAARPGSDGLMLQPYFEGERTPNLPDATATLSGMTLAATTPENLARAAVEGMLRSLAYGLEGIRRHGAQPSRLLLIGGGARNIAVQNIAPEIFGLPVTVPAPGEYVALGAVVQAAWTVTGNRPEWPIHE